MKENVQIKNGNRAGNHARHRGVGTLLFDLDGTLTNSFLGITRGAQYALRQYGIHIEDLNELTPFIGPPLIESFCELYGFSESQAEEAILHYRRYYGERGWLENEVYPGVENLLKGLKDKGYQLHIATSKSEYFTIKVLEHFDLLQYFDVIGSDTPDHLRNTKARVIDYVLRQAGITDRREAAMIGDRKYDMIGAHEAGILAIGVLYGFGSREELAVAGADMIVETIPDLAAALT